MIEQIKERYQQLQSRNGSSVLTPMEQHAFDAFNKLGIPTVKHEEWKYTRISSLFNKEFNYNFNDVKPSFTGAELDAIKLPGHETANVIVFVNGLFHTDLSIIRSKGLVIQPLEEAANNEFSALVKEHIGRSSHYIKDGIHALNTAFSGEGIYLHIHKGLVLEHPVYVYQINDAHAANVLAQPRSLVYIGEGAQVQMVETSVTLGVSESLTNGVTEVVVEKEALVDYYKIQADVASASQVSTTHFRQVGKSVVNIVTVSLNGGIVRNNLNIEMGAAHSEANMYGLYFIKGNTHVDNHTVVDNIKPHCLSNELYKGIIDDAATAVFNGKIYVQQEAQKTNAFQSNKNILLSDTASVNTKPQLEIFADDVKCSHGCTVGQLDEEGLFYLRSRGISEKNAKSLLVHAFAIDVLDRIKPAAIRHYVDTLISQRLDFNTL